MTCAPTWTLPGKTKLLAAGSPARRLGQSVTSHTLSVHVKALLLLSPKASGVMSNLEMDVLAQLGSGLKVLLG